MPTIWSRRQSLVFSGLTPGMRYDLPLILHDDDASDAFLVNHDNCLVPCCEDLLHEIEDCRLFWLSCDALPGGLARVYLYFSPKEFGESNAAPADEQTAAILMQFRHQEQVLTFSEFFRDSRRAFLGRWDLASGQTSFVHLEQFLSLDSGGVGTPLCGPAGYALWLDSSKGPVKLRRVLPSLVLQGKAEAEVLEKFKQWASDGDGRVGRETVRRILRGLDPSMSIEWLDTVFDKLDPDNNDDLDIERLLRFIFNGESEKPVPIRIHFRAHFYDFGDATGTHWVTCSHKLGVGRLGVKTECKFYCRNNGQEAQGWLETAVERSTGWHLFELTWEASSGSDRLNFIIDGVSTGCCDITRGITDLAVELGSDCGSSMGVWAGLELFHTTSAEVRPEATKRGDRQPWSFEREDEGQWQYDGTYVMEHFDMFEIRRHGDVVRVVDTKTKLLDAFSRFNDPQYNFIPGMEGMLGKLHLVQDVLPNGLVGLLASDSSGLWYFPPSVLSAAVPEPAEDPRAAESPSLLSPEPAPAAEDPEAVEQAAAAPEVPAPAPAVPAVPQEPVAAAAGLTLACWSIVGETDVARVERAVEELSRGLLAAGVVLPDNVRRIERCGQQHPGCFVYRFGTRRLHFSTRVEEGGRLLLIVRCGGGFVDFVDFAKRHGPLEHSKLRRAAASGDGSVRVTSVLTQGRMKVT